MLPLFRSARMAGVLGLLALAVACGPAAAPSQAPAANPPAAQAPAAPAAASPAAAAPAAPAAPVAASPAAAAPAPAASPASAPAAPAAASPAAAPASAAAATENKPIAPGVFARSSVGGTPKPGGILKVGVNQDQVGLDPHKTNSTASVHVLEHIYSSLLRLDENLTPQPDIAESYTADSPTQYTFKIRKGVKFHNGRELKAADVKYTIERVKDPATGSPRSSYVEDVDTIETPDDYTVVMKLKQAFAPLIGNLAQPTMAIVAKEVVEANNGDVSQGSAAIGTGPFKFVSWTPNSKIVLEKNKDYYIAGLPYLDGIEFTPIPDDTARTTAVRTNTVDFIEYAPWKDLKTLTEDKSLIVTGDLNTNYRYLGLNVSRKPFDNVKVRQAAAWAMDRQASVDASVFGAGAIISSGPMPPTSWAGIAAQMYSYDPNKAKQLMQESGVGTVKTSIKTGAAYSFLVNAALVAQENLRAIGWDVDVDQMEWGAFVSEYIKGESDAWVSGSSGFIDPDPILQPTFHSKGRQNGIKFSDADVDRLIDQGRATSDLTQRKQLYEQAQRRIAELAPYIFLYAANQYEAMTPKLKNYTHIMTGTNIAFREAWLDR